MYTSHVHKHAHLSTHSLTHTPHTTHYHTPHTTLRTPCRHTYMLPLTHTPHTTHTTMFTVTHAYPPIHTTSHTLHSHKLYYMHIHTTHLSQHTLCTPCSHATTHTLTTPHTYQVYIITTSTHTKHTSCSIVTLTHLSHHSTTTCTDIPLTPHTTHHVFVHVYTYTHTHALHSHRPSQYSVQLYTLSPYIPTHHTLHTYTHYSLHTIHTHTLHSRTLVGLCGLRRAANSFEPVGPALGPSKNAGHSRETRVGSASTWGLEEGNKSIRVRDRASAVTLSMPGMWCPRIQKLNFACKKYRQQSMRTRCLSLAAPELRTETTASLPLLHCTRQPLHCWPHLHAATVVGSISLTAIKAEEKGASWAHEICIQCECQTTPQPHVPEASNQMMSSNGLEGVKEKIDIPFHDCKNEAHHSKSALKEELRWM